MSNSPYSASHLHRCVYRMPPNVLLPPLTEPDPSPCDMQPCLNTSSTSDTPNCTGYDSLPRKRGRPKGSCNKTAAERFLISAIKHPVGRPPGTGPKQTARQLDLPGVGDRPQMPHQRSAEKHRTGLITNLVSVPRCRR